MYEYFIINTYVKNIIQKFDPDGGGENTFGFRDM